MNGPASRGVVLAVDQGSSSTRCVAYDDRMRVVGTAVSPVATSRPGPGMVEHDPVALLDGVLAVLDEARAGSEVAAVGIANQTETFVVWDAETGDAVSPLISWQDQRAEQEARARDGHADGVTALTGLPLDPTFSAPKLAWLFERDAGLLRRAEQGELLVGDVACWLAWKLSGGAAHVTEPSNASRSLLLDLDALHWDAWLCDLFGVTGTMLPEVRRSDAPGVGTSGAVAGFEAPIAAMLGDQQAALYGQGCTRPRMAALTLGTGAFLWLNVGPERPDPPGGVLATAAWDTARGRAYALEAFGANAGNALSLLRQLGLLSGPPSPMPDWSRRRPVLVPAPAGLGTPRWHGADRITLLGAASTTTAGDLHGAAVAGIAHQIVDALEAQHAATAMDVIRVGGGLAADASLLQAVADLAGLELEVSSLLEASAHGIAVLAAEAAGVVAEAAAAPAVARTVAPRLDADGRERERDRWRRAVDVHVGERAAV
ncbi:MAG TPA: FGGY family carbohydrate kinase [Gaiellales bacterium]